MIMVGFVFLIVGIALLPILYVVRHSIINAVNAISDILSHLYYPGTWNLSYCASAYRKVPTHLLIVADTPSGKRLGGLAAAAFHAGVRRTTIALAAGTWPEEQVKKLQTSFSASLTACRLPPAAVRTLDQISGGSSASAECALSEVSESSAEQTQSSSSAYSYEDWTTTLLVPAASAASCADAVAGVDFDAAIVLLDEQNGPSDGAFEVSEAAVEPELCVVLGQRDAAAGAPPTLVRYAEIVHDMPARWALPSVIRRSLSFYALTEQRRGK